MNSIRVGVVGRTSVKAAASVEEASVTRAVIWVEINGTRLTSAEHSLLNVSNEVGAGFHSTTIEVLGLPTFVLVDREGNELPEE